MDFREALRSSELVELRIRFHLLPGPHLLVFHSLGGSLSKDSFTSWTVLRSLAEFLSISWPANAETILVKV